MTEPSATTTVALFPTIQDEVRQQVQPLIEFLILDVSISVGAEEL